MRRSMITTSGLRRSASATAVSPSGASPTTRMCGDRSSASRKPSRTTSWSSAISHWIRVEHLKEDFLSFISHYADVSDNQRLAVQRLPPENTATYDRDLG